MLNRLATVFATPAGHPNGWAVGLFGALTVGSIWAGIAVEAWWLMALPAAILVGWLALLDFNRVYFLMLAGIPLSIEIELPGGLGTDLPSEQLMWLLTGVGTVWLLRHIRTLDVRLLWHPITLALLAHVGWITISAVTSQLFIVSFKYLLAKLWYLAVFYFMTAHVMNSERRFKELLWWFFLPLAAVVMVILYRHAGKGFSFEQVNYVMGPCFRNHVMYACTLAVFLPYLWFGTYWYKRYSFLWWVLVGGILLFLVGINFAFTRAAYVALVAAVGMYWFIRWRLLALGLAAFALVLALFVAFVRTDDNWLEFAPDYERTVTHTRFDNLLTATTRLEDISTMERVYRWVAATYMIKDKPLTGFGPGNFYFHYKNYTVTSFKTYVSDNPERSGIHNYFLMVTVEQGLPGLLIFLVFCLTVMFSGQRLYARAREPWQRRQIMAALLSFMLINLLMLMNDFIETDKIGSLYWIAAAILARPSLRSGVFQKGK